jgi:hypothetical protein
MSIVRSVFLASRILRLFLFWLCGTDWTCFVIFCPLLLSTSSQSEFDCYLERIIQAFLPMELGRAQFLKKLPSQFGGFCCWQSAYEELARGFPISLAPLELAATVGTRESCRQRSPKQYEHRQL